MESQRNYNAERSLESVLLSAALDWIKSAEKMAEACIGKNDALDWKYPESERSFLVGLLQGYRDSISILRALQRKDAGDGDA